MSYTFLEKSYSIFSGPNRSKMLIGQAEFVKWKKQKGEGRQTDRQLATGRTLHEVRHMYSITSSNLQITPVEVGAWFSPRYRRRN